jgi:hypothetical protein
MTRVCVGAQQDTQKKWSPCTYNHQARDPPLHARALSVKLLCQVQQTIPYNRASAAAKAARPSLANVFGLGEAVLLARLLGWPPKPGSLQRPGCSAAFLTLVIGTKFGTEADSVLDGNSAATVTPSPLAPR